MQLHPLIATELARDHARELAAGNDACMFATLFIGILDMRTGKVVLTNAGHNRPYLIRRGVAATPPRLAAPRQSKYASPS